MPGEQKNASALIEPHPEYGKDAKNVTQKCNVSKQ